MTVAQQAWLDASVTVMILLSPVFVYILLSVAKYFWRRFKRIRKESVS